MYPCTKNNGIDKRVRNGVVYKSYMSHCQHALDMPLDFIFLFMK